MVDRSEIAKIHDEAFVRTRFWWVRHAPVRDDGGRIYGQLDLSCDCSDGHVFVALARVLPHDAVWVASNLRRTHETARAIWAADRNKFAETSFRQVANLAEQNLGEWQGLNRAAFFASRKSTPGSFWFAAANITMYSGLLALLRGDFAEAARHAEELTQYGPDDANYHDDGERRDRYAIARPSQEARGNPSVRRKLLGKLSEPAF